ncbi:SET domain-containing protein-lysine N-methyltransferase [bacterium]|nr:SET domain-containing protein-lysine N-methyltransferase [bacterium]MCI0602605.1 SET domain-containing protein-lysine N-methyltransferase [bacterium]
MTQFTPETSRKKQSDSHFIKFAGRGENEIKVYTIEQFMAATGIVYLWELEFQDEKVAERIRMQCSHALETGSIGTDSRWLGALHAKEIESHYIADVSIRWIDETIGYGLFAEKDIAAWEYIGEYTGLVRKLNLIFGNINEYCFGYPTSAFSYRKHVIDALNQGNEIRYANHSESPNSESMGVLFDNILHIIVRAIKDIPASTEIVYDYTGSYRLFKRMRAYFLNSLKPRLRARLHLPS